MLGLPFSWLRIVNHMIFISKILKHHSSDYSPELSQRTGSWVSLNHSQSSMIKLQFHSATCNWLPAVRGKNSFLSSFRLEQLSKSIVASLQTTIPMMLQKLTLTTYSLVFSNCKKNLQIRPVKTIKFNLRIKKTQQMKDMKKSIETYSLC